MFIGAPHFLAVATCEESDELAQQRRLLLASCICLDHETELEGSQHVTIFIKLVVSLEGVKLGGTSSIESGENPGFIY